MYIIVDILFGLFWIRRILRIGEIIMSDLIKKFENMETDTITVLIVAAVLLIFLLVLIVVTIKVLKSNSEEEFDEEEDEIPINKDAIEEEDETSRKIKEAVASVEETRAKVEREKLAAAASDDSDAKLAARARVEEIAKAVSGEDKKPDEIPTENLKKDSNEETSKASDADDDESDEYDDYEDEVSEPTGKLDTVKIEEELRKVRKEAQDNVETLNEEAKKKAESPEYNASFDSAFVDKPVVDEERPEPIIPNPTPESMLKDVAADEKIAEESDNASDGVPTGSTLDASKGPDISSAIKNLRRSEKITVNPVNEVNINTVNSTEEVDTKNPKAGINGMEDMKEFMEENPEPKVKKRKIKKKDKVYEDKFGTHGDEIKTAKYYWYNTQDIEGLVRKEDMYFKCHYFDDANEVVLDLITEMYDCAYVRTEQLQRIAYGITFKSLGMKEILRSEENLGFNKDNATKEPTDSDKEEIYTKWCSYVDNFMKIIEINAPDSVKEYIVEKMYEYGHKDVEELMYSPY